MSQRSRTSCSGPRWAGRPASRRLRWRAPRWRPVAEARRRFRERFCAKRARRRRAALPAGVSGAVLGDCEPPLAVATRSRRGLRAERGGDRAGGDRDAVAAHAAGWPGGARALLRRARHPRPTGVVLVREGVRLRLGDLFRAWASRCRASGSRRSAASACAYSSTAELHGLPSAVALRRHAEIVLELGLTSRRTARSRSPRRVARPARNGVR